jgi:hypothetical protein
MVWFLCILNSAVYSREIYNNVLPYLTVTCILTNKRLKTYAVYATSNHHT